jgi:predicted XRE-type DNA-binding protein
LVLAEERSATSLIEKLSSRGFFCAFADAPDRVLSIAEQLQPEAILVAGAGTAQRSALEAVRQNADWAQLPVLADFSGGQSEAIRRLQFKFDDRVHSEDELTPRLEAALRAKRLIDRDARVQLRMEMLLEITQAATSSLELGEILRIAIDKVSRVVANDRWWRAPAPERRKWWPRASGRISPRCRSICSTIRSFARRWRRARQCTSRMQAGTR